MQVLQSLEVADIPGLKVQCTVHDEAANMMLAGRILGKDNSRQSERCAAHKLQTCIRHGIGGRVDQPLSRRVDVYAHNTSQYV